jgi:hypothetical protein
MLLIIQFRSFPIILPSDILFKTVPFNMPSRKILPAEEVFLTFMVNRAALQLPDNWKEALMVKPMDEGGMGSLLLLPEGKEMPGREFGKTVFEYQFKDEDRITVLASLNLDEQGHLFELDIWKENFEPLIRFPQVYE